MYINNTPNLLLKSSTVLFDIQNYSPLRPVVKLHKPTDARTDCVFLRERKSYIVCSSRRIPANFNVLHDICTKINLQLSVEYVVIHFS